MTITDHEPDTLPHSHPVAAMPPRRRRRGLLGGGVVVLLAIGVVGWLCMFLAECRRSRPANRRRRR